jgi:hypothetical protein
MRQEQDHNNGQRQRAAGHCDLDGRIGIRRHGHEQFERIHHVDRAERRDPHIPDDPGGFGPIQLGSLGRDARAGGFESSGGYDTRAARSYQQPASG